ncbi:response regulator [Altericista sp. CCNU0014]|uniref:response regulator n=1 Tax=Altericista sp. CCNU0014 TaxID=3082949 RepID=UPI00384CBAEF
MKILLVEDDEAVIALLAKSLSAYRYVVDAVRDGETGWTYGSTFEYDLIVMDVMLPKLDGIALCQRFRAEDHTLPILLLTSLDSSTAKIQGLNAGADDYVIKPFNVEELIARIRALLRRSSANPSVLRSWGDLLLDPTTCEVTYNGQPLILTTKEYELLELLLQDSRCVLSNDEILDRLWSSDDFPAEATVRSHVRRLRSKLQEAGAPRDFISTMYGRGYYLKSPQTAIQLSQSFSDEPSPSSLSANREANQNARYLEFLKDAWVTTQPHCLSQVEVLSQAVRALPTDGFTETLQHEAHHVAHKLAGTLGMFGLVRGASIARQLEATFGRAERLQPEQAPDLEDPLEMLRQEIQSAPVLLPLPARAEHSGAMLAIDADASFTQPLAEMASQKGIRCTIAPSLASAHQFLAETTPDVVLLRSPPSSQRSEFLQTLSTRLPKIPVLVVGHPDDLDQRLEVSRWGGKFLSERSATLEQTIACAMGLVRPLTAEAKIVFVDDDVLWLRNLPALLEPWRFKLTTLSNPLQFWDVLQSVKPDALVLDLKMPDIDGLELCRIVRSDPLLQRLPVLFVSAVEDATAQNEAFQAGADDYICKPVTANVLATRILNRLQRIRAWAR